MDDQRMIRSFLAQAPPSAEKELLRAASQGGPSGMLTGAGYLLAQTGSPKLDAAVRCRAGAPRRRA
jgi:hypothetical protein